MRCDPCAWRAAHGANAAYAEGMATTPFTLAALATSAVAGLVVTGARAHTSGSGGAFTSAVLDTADHAVIVRIPATEAAEVQQSAELLSAAALADGARAHLPFAVPATLGITRAGESRAVVSTFLPGIHAQLTDIEADSELLQHVTEAIVSIHELPSGVVRAGGLPVRSASEVRSGMERLVERAAETGMLPATVRGRWNDVLDAEEVWSFEPLVVHGALAPEMLLVEGSDVTGVLGWHELSLGDPASDLHWLLLADPEVFESAMARYTALRGVSGQQELSIRAKFYHELEVAKWLLHGIESHDQSVVDDAVTMLDRLVDRLGLLGAPLPKQRVLSEHEVEQMLDETPVDAYDARSETAEFESLDEDRAFLFDGDFASDPAESDEQPSDGRPSNKHSSDEQSSDNHSSDEKTSNEQSSDEQTSPER